MKKLLVIIVGIIACSSGKSQSINEIVGIWQLSSPEIGSAYLDTYQFFPNGLFVFHVNEYDELKQIVSIKGKYVVYQDSIKLAPISMVTYNGSKLDRSKSTSVHDSWSLSGNLIKNEIFLEEQPTFIAKLVFHKQQDGKLSILIDGLEYYLLTKDPNDYK